MPTHQESQALLRAARRGVDVRLLLPSHSDSFPALAVQHSHYHAMLRAGVKIYEREDGILHSKTVVADGVWSIVGSSNFDHRSVLFNDEVDAVVIGAHTGAELEQYFQQDLQHAQRIEAASWGRRPLPSACVSSSGGFGRSCCDGPGGQRLRALGGYFELAGASGANTCICSSNGPPVS